MTMRNLTVLDLISVRQATATVTGADVDLATSTLGFINAGGREVKGHASVGISGTDTDETCAVTIEESPTTVSSDFTNIATFTSVAQEGTDLSEEQHFRISPTTNFLRAVATIAGTTPVFDLHVFVLLEERQA